VQKVPEQKTVGRERSYIANKRRVKKAKKQPCMFIQLIDFPIEERQN